MVKHFSVLQRIDGNEEITEETHYEFLCRLQSAMLLELRERGQLDVMQYRRAAEKLDRQRRERARDILKRGEEDL